MRPSSMISYEFKLEDQGEMFHRTTNGVHDLLECPLVLRVFRSGVRDLDKLQRKVVAGMKKMVCELNQGEDV